MLFIFTAAVKLQKTVNMQTRSQDSVLCPHLSCGPYPRLGGQPSVTADVWVAPVW